jgi:hypothetical protein
MKKSKDLSRFVFLRPCWAELICLIIGEPIAGADVESPVSVSRFMYKTGRRICQPAQAGFRRYCDLAIMAIKSRNYQPHTVTGGVHPKLEGMPTH